MSYRHQAGFDAIKREYEQVAKLLLALATKGRTTKPGSKGKLASLPRFDPVIISAAVATANDAYVLLLIATAEGFMREYLTSRGIPTGDEPKLSTLIDKSRKEFNKPNPRVKILLQTAIELHNLRIQRNFHAHGGGRIVFPPVVQVVHVLGKFFKDIP